jgi:hypothetical protein
MGASREGYNEAVQASDQRELLLNLVRLRYEEAPEFLAISGISTQMNFSAAASIGGEIGEAGDTDVGFLAPGAAVGYSEAPTITFLPRRDQEFTRQLVAPVDLDSIYLLTRYGWGIDRVLLLVVSEMNGLHNGASHGTMDREARAFRELAAQLGELERQNRLQVAVERRRAVLSAPIEADRVDASQVLEAARDGYQLEAGKDGTYLVTGESNHYVLAMEPGPDGIDSPAFESLALTPGRTVLELDLAGVPDAVDLRLTTRSVLSSMAWLSGAVSVPGAHSSIVPRVDPDLVPGDMMDIRVSSEPVDNAFLAVEHRGYWFYIDDKDLESKRTLGLLTSLMRLSISAGGAQNVPVLTLPVAR